PLGSRRSPPDSASERRERATRTERAGEAASTSACRGVRGAQPLGSRRSPPDSASERRERATRTERAGEAASKSAGRGARGAKPLGSKMTFGAMAAWQAWLLMAAAGAAAVWLFLLKVRPPRVRVPSLL